MRVIEIVYFDLTGNQTKHVHDPRHSEASYGGDLDKYPIYKNFIKKLNNHMKYKAAGEVYEFWYDSMKLTISRTQIMELCDTLLHQSYYGKGQRDILNVLGFHVKQRNGPFENW